MIAVGLAPMMEEQENLETRRVIRHRSEVGVCVISNYAVISELRVLYSVSCGKHTSVMYVGAGNNSPIYLTGKRQKNGYSMVRNGQGDRKG